MCGVIVFWILKLTDMNLRRVAAFLIILVLSMKSYANQIDNLNNESGIYPVESSVVNNKYNSRANCNSYGLLCDVSFGLKMAESEGVNGIILSGYSYHLKFDNMPSSFFHVPTGITENETNNGVYNEFTYGLGYSRSFYNPDYNSEYSLFLLGFQDSFYQPEFQGGFYYQKFLDLTDSGMYKFGFGYSAFLWVKPAEFGELPLVLPGASPMITLKAYDLTFSLSYAGYNVLYLAMQVDLPNL